MPGIAMDEACGCANPLLQFCYQADGILTDVAELKFTITQLDGTERKSETSVTLTDCDDGGGKLGTGRYVATFTPETTEPVTWAPGTHIITWAYKVELTDTTQYYRQKFEVLDKINFPSGKGYRAYADATTLAANSAFTGYTLAQIQEALWQVAEQIEALTGRFFDPTYIDSKYNGTKATALPLGHPIIGLSNVELVSGSDTVLDFDLTSLAIYNRHLTSGLKDPDDRDNPRIEFISSYSGVSGITADIYGSFSPGRQNVRVVGMFGYTEYDGTPAGTRPKLLEKAAALLALRTLEDPFGLDIVGSSPGRIRSARTRDQSVTFASATEGGVGPLTGDRSVDDILMVYRRPAHFFAVNAMVTEDVDR
jgi:hypothetical protein